MPPIAFQIKVVETFVYLGIAIHRAISRYAVLNINPLFIKFKQKAISWCKLPLSVVGSVNNNKMIWMPQLLYALHNAPVWLPISLFKWLDTIFRMLIWKKRNAGVKLETLQKAKGNGGLAIPNPLLYFLSAQLQHLTGSEADMRIDPIRKILSMLFSDKKLVDRLQADNFSLARQFPILAMIDKVWNWIKEHCHYNEYTDYTHIILNFNFLELLKLHGFNQWSERGLVYIPQLYQGQHFKDF